MGTSLRADIRQYEAERKMKVKEFSWPHIRCLYCPASFFGCGIAKKSLKTEEKQ